MGTYLVTGVAGFIASRTAALLLENGHQVVGVDNLNDYYDVGLKEWRLSTLQSSERFTFVKADIEDKPKIDQLFQEYSFDAVLNLAARAGVRYSMEHPEVYMTTNAMGTLNLLEGMKATGVKKLVLASTSSLYAGQSMPFVETLPVNSPISPYAASKKAAEVMAYSYHFLYDIDVSVVRYFTVFGPAGRPDMSIYRFIQWIKNGIPMELFGDGSQSRDFTFVDDIARGTVAALHPVGYEIFNLGGGKNPISLNTIIEMIEKELGLEAKRNTHAFHKADMTETWADIAKAKERLGWEPEVSVEDGLKRTVAWHLENQKKLAGIQM